MYPKLKISHHKHSGRLLAHEFTSYIPLAFIVFVAGVILVIGSFPIAFADHPGPQSGSVGLTGTMPAPPPTQAATITSPSDGQHFKISPITISGNCPDNTLVEIYKNNIFAGSVSCGHGKFSLEIDLLFGQNVITAIVYDALNQAGPASNSLTIYYDSVLPGGDPLSQLNLSSSQLLLTTNSVYRGAFPGQQLNVPVTVIGGAPPYAVDVIWGDARSKIIPRNDNQTFNASHAYQKPGTFGITLQATDGQERTAFLTVAAIVNGQPSANTSSNSGKVGVNSLLILWPLYAIAGTMVVSFWLGERREKRVLSGKITPQHPLFPTATNPPPTPPQEKTLAK